MPAAPIVVLLPLVVVSVLAVPLPVVLPPELAPAAVLLSVPVVPLPAVLPPGVVVLLLAPVVPCVVLSEPAGPALGLVPEVPLPEVWAMDHPPMANAAAAANIVRVCFIMSSSLSEMKTGKAPKGESRQPATCQPLRSLRFHAANDRWAIAAALCRTIAVTFCWFDP